MAFTIRFEGLICHVGTEADPGHKLHAVLISDIGTHVPVLTIGGANRTLNAGDTIRFSTGAGSARTTQFFKDRVQGLKELLSGGTIHPTVLGATHNGANGALSYVIFPNGELDAPEFANEPLQFVVNGVFLKKKCVARGVTFTSDADATELTIENAGAVVHRAPLAAGSAVVITNVSNTGTGHFQLYRNITNAPTMATADADFSLKCTANQLNAAAPGSLFVIKEQVFAAAAEKLAKQEATKASYEGTKENKPATVSATPPVVPHAECSNSNWP